NFAASSTKLGIGRMIAAMSCIFSLHANATTDGKIVTSWATIVRAFQVRLRNWWSVSVLKTFMSFHLWNRATINRSFAVSHRRSGQPTCDVGSFDGTRTVIDRRSEAER